MTARGEREGEQVKCHAIPGFREIGDQIVLVDFVHRSRGAGDHARASLAAPGQTGAVRSRFRILALAREWVYARPRSRVFPIKNVRAAGRRGAGLRRPRRAYGLRSRTWRPE